MRNSGSPTHEAGLQLLFEPIRIAPDVDGDRVMQDPLYDPSRIVAPTLIVTAAWDDVNPPALGRAVFAKLTSAVTKRYVEIGDASHLVMLERNRLQLFREVQLFLDEPRP
jgi:pimeloyl-ACP methyl ester carboxylesterase